MNMKMEVSAKLIDAEVQAHICNGKQSKAILKALAGIVSLAIVQVMLLGF